MGYVIVWGDMWQFETVPARLHHRARGEQVYVTKGAALNAAITRLHRERDALDDAIRIAKKRQRNADRCVARRDAV